GFFDSGAMIRFRYRIEAFNLDLGSPPDRIYDCQQNFLFPIFQSDCAVRSWHSPYFSRIGSVLNIILNPSKNTSTCNLLAHPGTVLQELPMRGALESHGKYHRKRYQPAF